MPLQPPTGTGTGANFQLLDQLEADLSKYTLNEEMMIAAHSAAASSTSSDTGTASPAPEPYLDSRSNTTLDPVPASNGLIHGHVHNFDNFTYIHGHIHTNDAEFLESQMGFSLPTGKPALRRLSSHHHHHPNDAHSAQFSDCQHFEFLNCHDQQAKPVIVEDPKMTCQEDENCKPKLLEICCDTTHGNGEPFIPMFPDLGNASSSFDHPNDDKTFEHCNFDDCVDVKCDLDTCDIDDLYCKYCENLDDFPDIKAGIEERKSAQQSPSATQESTHVHTHTHGQEDSFNQHLFATPSAHQRSKREREEDREPQSPVHHHLHHHTHHTHPENHHHHHIQLHDHHHTKKIKSEPGASDSHINFEWNFKNQQAKCQWDSCSSHFDNTLLLQTHIVENHLVPEFNMHTISDETDNGAYECEWKNCDFMGDGMPSLLSHINSQHSGYPANDSSSLTMRKDLLTPSPDDRLFTSEHDDVDHKQTKYIGSNDEETVCKWLIASVDGTTRHTCNKKFSNAEDLTHHLVEDHVGSGKSIYCCHWSGCDRNGQEFRQRQKALRHLHTHTHYKPLQCDVCGRRFAVDTMLKQHMRTHSGEKPYKCPTCDKRFATSSSLSVHLRTHTGEKPLSCKYPGCGKRFSESSNLTKHMKIHEKEFKCDCCLRSFATLKQLKSHNAKYHSESG